MKIYSRPTCKWLLAYSFFTNRKNTFNTFCLFFYQRNTKTSKSLRSWNSNQTLLKGSKIKARKMISIITVVAMLTALVIGGTGNLYANETQEQKKLELIEVLVADLSLSETQKEKYADFRSSIKAQAVVKKQEKNMDFVKKLTTVMSF